MNRLIKRLTVYMTLILVIVFIGVQYNIISSRKTVDEKVKNQVMISSEIMQEEVEDWVQESKTIINNLGRSVSYFNWNQTQLNDYLKDIVVTYPEFDVIYYADESGVFIISNDWQPPAFLDMRHRPWYTTALESEGVTITRPYEDAMTGETIVTFSKAVQDHNGKASAVVGGDISLAALEDKFNRYAAMSSSEYMLFDTTDQGRLAVLTQQLETVSSEQLLNWHDETATKTQKKPTMRLVDTQSTSGYFHVHLIGGSNWCMVNYSPLSAFAHEVEDNERLVYIHYGLLCVFLFIFYFFHRNYIIKPLLSLGDRIGRIDVKRDPSYRLQVDDHEIFKPTIKAINKVLNEVERNMENLEEDREEIYAMNEELEATLQQISAAEQEVNRQKLNFEALFSNNQSAVAMVNSDHLITDINLAFTKLFGYTLSEIEGLNLDDIVAPLGENSNAKSYTEDLLNGQHIITEGIRYNKDRMPIEVRIQGVPITRHDYFVGGYGIYTDISNLKQQERHRYYASTHDDLTGLFNRTYMNEKLTAYRESDVYPLAIIIIDVNGLKIINDGFGPSVGDRLLVDIANTLSEVCHPENIVIRFGGDEFAILVTHKSLEETQLLVKEIKRNCGEMSIQDTKVSLSIGWSIQESVYDDIEVVLRDAEDDMYKHKVMENSSVKGKTVYTMINALHETNKREEEHSRRVSALCERFGEALALSDREMNALKSMSLLHDIGKIAIDEKILNKPGKLSNDEYEDMKRHPEIGYRILSAVPELNEIAEYVLAHHERWDGNGYPRGLKQEDIPYLARIITIVDAYDAMTSDRSYRDAQDESWAIKELEANAGLQFDPVLVPIFTRVLKG